MSEIEYWKSEESDHVAIACKMQMKCERKMKERKEGKKKISFKIVDGRCRAMLEHSKKRDQTDA